MASSTEVAMERTAYAEGLVRARDIQQPGDGLRFCHGRILDELPGAVFAAVTLVWIVSSFAHLIW
jgi:hypothetical protein